MLQTHAQAIHKSVMKAWSPRFRTAQKGEGGDPWGSTRWHLSYLIEPSRLLSRFQYGLARTFELVFGFSLGIYPGLRNSVQKIVEEMVQGQKRALRGPCPPEMLLAGSSDLQLVALLPADCIWG